MTVYTWPIVSAPSTGVRRPHPAHDHPFQTSPAAGLLDQPPSGLSAPPSPHAEGSHGGRIPSEAAFANPVDVTPVPPEPVTMFVSAPAAAATGGSTGQSRWPRSPAGVWTRDPRLRGRAPRARTHPERDPMPSVTRYLGRQVRRQLIAEIPPAAPADIGDSSANCSTDADSPRASAT